MDDDRLVEAYATLFPRRLRMAHVALVHYAEEASPDGWPTPKQVATFARMYRVPRAPLGGLVGLLCRRPNGARRDVWVDAIRNPDKATPHLICQHDLDALTAFGWCLFARDAWMPSPTMH